MKALGDLYCGETYVYSTYGSFLDETWLSSFYYFRNILQYIHSMIVRSNYQSNDTYLSKVLQSNPSPSHQFPELRIL
jgi:hypothetical protein